MTKWEYLLINIPDLSDKDDAERDLDEVGGDGWELIGAINGRMIFKKPLEEDDR